MRKTLKEIAQTINGEVLGDADTVITGVSGIKEAGPGDITFLANPKYAPLMESTKASAIITSREVESAGKPLIRTDNPSLAFVQVVSLVLPNEVKHPKGTHPTAILGEGVKLGRDVNIGAYVVIEDNVAIGDDTTIYSHCFIGSNSTIGCGSLIYSNVSIRERISIGNRVIIHSGAVIGSDGFGFVQVQGVHHKIPQIGIVEVQDDVEIGANVTIDRARFEKTVIGKGTKIDNLVQIAHNVVIGEGSIIIAQAGISGSTNIGKGVILAGQVGVVGHISIGDGATVAAQSGVSKSVPANTTVWGYPAKPIVLAKKINACIQRLPAIFQTLAELKKRVEELERLIDHGKTKDNK
jgi:UDP-3-O-[3-hydroxymyristoyl] glucosamine N-acyltransferase